MSIDFDPFNLDDVDPYQIKKYTTQFDVERWYQNIEEHTIPSRFVPLSLEEITAIVQAYTFQVNRELTRDDRIKKKAGQKILERLERKIDLELKAANFDGGHAFVRLSTRSPKDAVLRLPALKEHLKRELRGKPPDANADTICWYISVCHAMRMKSGKEMVELLINSSRTNQDLLRLLATPDPSTINGKGKSAMNGTGSISKKGKNGISPTDVFPVNIILRQWVFIHPQDEFRVFLFEGYITGISQYIDVCFFPELLQDYEEIKRLVFELFYEKKPNLPRTCVVDLALVEQADPEEIAKARSLGYSDRVARKRLIIIEINPFFVKTGAALFDWNFDRELLTSHPESPEEFDFRIIRTKETRRMQGFMDVRAEIQDEKTKTPYEGATMTSTMTTTTASVTEAVIAAMAKEGAFSETRGCIVM